ncbi:MAG: tRNA pseudouridine(55) synthase TruB [Patescibacteria group bacterium]|nr:tRNA pseudouridine(55) synthase TruB [Patescibacteria group bacterium]
MKSGILLVNKPSGISSHDVVFRTRKALQVKEVGHTGTLDPLASGLMVLCIGFATKLADNLIKKEKTYVVQARLFASSDSYDTETLVKDLEKLDVSKQRILEVLESFKGEIDQMPPQYSALKVNGQKACDVARKGGRVNLQSRKITISQLDLLSFDGECFECRVSCSSGTYIRSLVHDIAVALGTDAVMTDLIRTQVSQYDLEKACEIADISWDHVYGPDFLKQEFASVDLDETQINKIKFGQKIRSPKDFQEGDIVLLFCSGSLCCVAEYRSETKALQPKKINSKMFS